MMLYPYSILKCSDNEWKLLRYNTITMDWNILGDNYSSEADCLEEMRKLNRESGTINVNL